MTNLIIAFGMTLLPAPESRHHARAIVLPQRQAHGRRPDERHAVA